MRKALVIAGVLLVSYVTAYFLLVTAWEPQRILGPLPEMRPPRYRFGGEAAEFIFHPIQVLDVSIRRDYWLWVAEDHDPANAAPAPKNESSQVDPENDVFVAMIDSYDDKILDAITEELKAHNIACYIEGSIGQSVSVSQNDAAKAREIIRDSKRIDHEHVSILEP